MKSGESLFSPDRHKTNLVGRPAFRRDLAYDPEGLAFVAGQQRKREDFGLPFFLLLATFFNHFFIRDALQCIWIVTDH